MIEPIAFEGSNTVFAKDQPQYLPLPALLELEDDTGVVTTCWKLGLRERLSVLFKGRVWVQQFTFRNPLQPQRVTVYQPFALCDNRKVYAQGKALP